MQNTFIKNKLILCDSYFIIMLEKSKYIKA